MTGWNEAFPYESASPAWRHGRPEATWQDIAEWCQRTYGEGGWEYYNSTFNFKTERDLMLFKLKWMT